MGEILTIVGGVSILFGAFDVLDSRRNDKEKDWKRPIMRIVVGILVVGAGILMKRFGA